MSFVKNKTFVSGAAIGAAAMLLAGAGGYFAYAQGAGGAVNAPARVGALAATPGSFANLVAKVAPAVVSIHVVEKAGANPAVDEERGASPFGEGNPFGFNFRFLFPQAPGQNAAPIRASGSGFFISPDGYIVTNNHVVQGAEKITVVTNENHSFHAHVVGTDPATDLAVIKVDGGPFPYVSFEDRAQPRVGDWVVAVGNPFGLGGTATAGIVSALGRQNVSGSSYVDYMQIDAPINRGNSGGPTFDVEGHVVGVNTAIYTPSGGSVGIGFDIPASVAAHVSHELIARGSVTRGFIGATVQSLTPALADSLGMKGEKGALIDQLTPGGPAQRAGAHSGDVVVSVNGRPVDSSDALTRQVAMATPGQDIEVGILRGGHPMRIAIRAGLRPPESQLAAREGQGGELQGAMPGGAMLGMQLAPDPGGGLVVQGISPNSDAAQQGVRQGDVILRAGQRPMRSPADLSRAVAAAKSAGRESVPLLVARGGEHFYVPVHIAPQGAG
ncbi:MAG: Do family serine endopeptidase [Caulobacteraceae bacterium]